MASVEPRFGGPDLDPLRSEHLSSQSAAQSLHDLQGDMDVQQSEAGQEGMMDEDG